MDQIRLDAIRARFKRYNDALEANDVPGSDAAWDAMEIWVHSDYEDMLAEIDRLTAALNLLESDRDAERKIRLDAEAEADAWRRRAEAALPDMFNPVFVNRDGTTRPTALAVDFDGTLCEPAWPGFGTPNMWLIERLISFREQGGELILWTNREGEPLQAAVDFCAGHGLHFDAVNANLPRWKEFFKNDTRKPGADYYIDDKAVCIKADWRGPVEGGAKDAGVGQGAR